VAFDPKSGHVFVVNGDPGTLTVIDPKTDTAIATVNVGGKLEYAVADGRGALYVNGNEKNEIVRVDTASNQSRPLADEHVQGAHRARDRYAVTAPVLLVPQRCDGGRGRHQRPCRDHSADRAWHR